VGEIAWLSHINYLYLNMQIKDYKWPIT
jgi:hypothetical protein